MPARPKNMGCDLGLLPCHFILIDTEIQTIWTEKLSDGLKTVYSKIPKCP